MKAIFERISGFVNLATDVGKAANRLNSTTATGLPKAKYGTFCFFLFYEPFPFFIYQPLAYGNQETFAA